MTTSSTCTSAICAPSSATIRALRGTCGRSAASATGWETGNESPLVGQPRRQAAARPAAGRDRRRADAAARGAAARSGDLPRTRPRRARVRPTGCRPPSGHGVSHRDADLSRESRSPRPSRPRWPSAGSSRRASSNRYARSPPPRNGSPAGTHTARVPVRGTDELAQLADAFNEMAASLEHAEQIRRQLLADVAHELRTPLATVESYVEALADGVLARGCTRTGARSARRPPGWAASSTTCNKSHAPRRTNSTCTQRPSGPASWCRTRSTPPARPYASKNVALESEIQPNLPSG